MNLRLPAVLSIVAVAAGVAVVRARQAPAPVAAPAFSSAQESDSPQPPERRRIAAPPLARVVVYVAGAVVHGGVYRLPPSSRAVDALHAAGGAIASADLVAVNLAAPLADGDEIVVPVKGTVADVASGSDASASDHRKRKRHRAKHHKRHKRTIENVAATDDSSSPSGESGDAVSATADASTATPIDLNSADANALETLPGIGSKLAERIVTFRELNGPFAAHDDLLDVGGMTQKRLDAIEPFLLTP